MLSIQIPEISYVQAGCWVERWWSRGLCWATRRTAQEAIP